MADESMTTDGCLFAAMGDKFFVVDALGVYLLAKFLKIREYFSGGIDLGYGVGLFDCLADKFTHTDVVLRGKLGE